MIPAFLLKSPLASGLGIAVILLGIAVGVQSFRLARAQTALTEEKLAFSDFKKELAVQSLAVVQAAAAKSAEQVDRLTAEVRSIGIIGAQTKTEIRYVQSNGGPCPADPVYRATVSGVRDILDAGNPSRDKGAAGGRAPATVRGANASGPGKVSQ